VFKKIQNQIPEPKTRYPIQKFEYQNRNIRNIRFKYRTDTFFGYLVGVRVGQFTNSGTRKPDFLKKN